MRWTLEAFKDVAAVVQSVALAIAVVIGGFWTLYVFTALAQREKAELDVQKALLEKKKQEEELAPRAIIDLKLQVSQRTWFAKGRPMVQIDITATNRGNRLETLSFPPAPVRVHALLSNQLDGSLSLVAITEISQLETLRFDYYSLSPAESSVLAPILITVPTASVYLFGVCVPLDRATELQTTKRRPDGILNVCDAKLLHVK